MRILFLSYLAKLLARLGLEASCTSQANGLLGRALHADGLSFGAA